MKKASNILLLVGGILSINSAVIMLILAVVLFAGGQFFADAIKAGIENGTIPTEGTAFTAEQLDAFIKMYFAVLGVTFVVVGGLCIPGAIFSFKARSADSKTGYILAIVFGAMTNALTLVGAILGLIAFSKSERDNN